MGFEGQEAGFWGLLYNMASAVCRGEETQTGTSRHGEKGSHEDCSSSSLVPTVTSFFMCI